MVRENIQDGINAASIQTVGCSTIIIPKPVDTPQVSGIVSEIDLILWTIFP
jgi:hypothetical protein